MLVWRLNIILDYAICTTVSSIYPNNITATYLVGCLVKMTFISVTCMHSCKNFIKFSPLAGSLTDVLVFVFQKVLWCYQIRHLEYRLMNYWEKLKDAMCHPLLQPLWNSLKNMVSKLFVITGIIVRKMPLLCCADSLNHMINARIFFSITSPISVFIAYYLVSQ